MDAEAGWTLRMARAEDAAELGRLHTQGWQQGYRGLLPDHYLDSLDETEARDRWARTLAAPQGLRIVVAEHDSADGLLGFCSTGPCFDPDVTAGEWEVWDAWVDAGARGLGIGSELLRAVLGLAPAHVDVVVWVLANNIRGLRFYKRNSAGWDGLRRKTRRPGGVIIEDVRLRWQSPRNQPSGD